MPKKTKLQDRQVKLRFLAPLVENTNLHTGARAILCMFTSISDDEGYLVFPGRRLLAQALGVAYNTVDLGVTELVREQLLVFSGPEEPGVQCKLVCPDSVSHNAFNTILQLSLQSGLTQSGSKPDLGAPVRRQPGRPPKTAMADRDKQLVCASLENMQTYLLYGKDAIGALPGVKHEPTNMNWQWVKDSTGQRTAITQEQPRFEDWTKSQLAGYWWDLVSMFRHENGIPLTIPNWSRLISDISRSTLTNAQLVEFMHVAVGEYRRIVQMCDKIAPPPLGDTSFSNGLLRTKVEQILNMAQMNITPKEPRRAQGYE